MAILKNTKEELIEARRVLVDHTMQSYVNDETFKILRKLIEELEAEISKR